MVAWERAWGTLWSWRMGLGHGKGTWPWWRGIAAGMAGRASARKAGKPQPTYQHDAGAGRDAVQHRPQQARLCGICQGMGPQRLQGSGRQGDCGRCAWGSMNRVSSMLGRICLHPLLFPLVPASAIPIPSNPPSKPHKLPVNLIYHRKIQISSHPPVSACPLGCRPPSAEY